MNKLQNSEDAIKELETTGELGILESTEEEREYEKIIEKSNYLQDYIKGLKDANYSEFMIGACVTVQLMSQKKMKVTSSWGKMKRMFTPAFMRK